MKLYFAGSYSGLSIPELKKIAIKYKLYSYYNEIKQAAEWGNEGLMLDSGAFSVFTKNAKINIDNLIEFIKRFKIKTAIQLDVIGNEKETWQNYCYMTKKGVKTLPVFHYKASKMHIERVMNSSDYICLGGLVPLSKKRKELEAWLNYIFSFNRAKQIKMHCLGIHTKNILEKYPFYSADSSSALSINRYPSENKFLFFKQKTNHYTKLYEVGIQEQLKLEKYITNLWESRGIKWKE